MLDRSARARRRIETEGEEIGQADPPAQTAVVVHHIDRPVGHFDQHRPGVGNRTGLVHCGDRSLRQVGHGRSADRLFRRIHLGHDAALTELPMEE